MIAGQERQQEPEGIRKIKMKISKTALSLFVIIAGGYLFFTKRPIDIKSLDAASSAKIINDYADKVVAKCTSASYKPGCYEEEVPKLMDFMTMRQAFEVTRSIQDKDKSYAYCHVLGHKLSAKETAKDPNRWKEVITGCPSGLCSNGCIHGAFQERFRREVLSSEEVDKMKAEIKDVCEPRHNWSPTGLEQGTCYHALGHLLMYITGADIKKSLKVCEEVSIKDSGQDWSKLCFDGAFMQIFQPLETEDFALVRGKQPKKEELKSFCDKFPENQRGSCWSEGWPLYLQEIEKPAGLVKFCSGSMIQSRDAEDRCYLGMFYVLTAEFQFDLSKVKELCLGLPSLRLNQCFANAASRMIETDYRNISLVTDFCSQVPSEDGKNICFRELIRYSTYNFHPGSNEFFQLCNGLPDKWKTQCLGGYK